MNILRAANPTLYDVIQPYRVKHDAEMPWARLYNNGITRKAADPENFKNKCVVCKIAPARTRSCGSCRVEYKKAYRKKQYWRSRELNIRAAVEWGRKNKEKRHAIVASYRKRKPEVSRLACSIYSFRRRRLPGVGDTGFTAQEWKSVVAKFNNSCAYCRRADLKLTIDHVVPLSKGGSIGIDNIVPACGPCNSKKGNRPVELLR